MMSIKQVKPVARPAILINENTLFFNRLRHATLK
jgi:hypothetical protein